jgi:uncharacterized membrane protein (DUF4010 family)
MNLLPNSADATALIGLCVALGIGMLVGAERERRKGTGPDRGAAGIRTFSVVSLVGAVAVLVGEALVLSVAVLTVGALAYAAYRRAAVDDPGLTTEVSLLLTCLLGGLAVNSPLLAAGAGAALALLLAARQRIHRFVRSVMSERELHDALLFVAAALIMLPIAPDRYVGPFQSINPHTIASLIVLVMAASATGYIATRAMGPRYGLALAGFAGGFISSTATIHAMGARAAKFPALRDAATAGAVLSSVATFIQLALIVAVVQPSLLSLIGWPLAAGGVVSAAYGLLLMLRMPKTAEPQASSRNTSAAEAHSDIPPAGPALGRAFDLKQALVFAAVVSTVLMTSAGLHQWLGDRGALLAAGIAGLADAHATTASTLSLSAAGKIAPPTAVSLILVGLSTNSLAKAVVALSAGGSDFVMRTVPGLVLMVLAAWGAMWMFV